MTENLKLTELNKTMLSGRTTHDLELRFTDSNQAVTGFRIAANKRYKDKQTGKWKELVSYIPVVAWGKLAERCAEQLKKGNAISVEGRLQSRNFENKEGEKKFIIEVIAERIQFLTKTDSEQKNSALT